MLWSRKPQLFRKSTQEPFWLRNFIWCSFLGDWTYFFDDKQSCLLSLPLIDILRDQIIYYLSEKKYKMWHRWPNLIEEHKMNCNCGFSKLVYQTGFQSSFCCLYCLIYFWDIFVWSYDLSFIFQVISSLRLSCIVNKGTYWQR